jgi:hypothetical protein
VTRTRQLLALIFGILAIALPFTIARAETPSFTASLTEENKTAVGLAKLSPEQLAALDAQIAREISVARQGDTVAFSTSFTRRRTPQQRKDAGLDQLMTPELARLDMLVAAAVATKPDPTGPTITLPAATAPTSNWVEITPRKMQVHGEVTLAYMWGSGGQSGYGASMFTTVTDPSGKFSFTLGLSQFHGKGFYYPYGEYPCYRGW